MRLDALISAHGYWVVLLGTFLEGETVLVLGGVAAHQGLLRLPGVMLCAFVGSAVGDQLFFWFGRWRGLPWIARKATRQQVADRVRELAHRGGRPFLVGFRFLYGLRSITPLALGASGFPPARFLLWNVVGAALWSVAVAGLGYILGQAAEGMIGRFRHHSQRFLAVLVAVAAVVWLARWVSRTARK